MNEVQILNISNNIIIEDKRYPAMEDEQYLIDIVKILLEIEDERELDFLFKLNITNGVYRSELISFNKNNRYEFHYLFCDNLRFQSKEICMKYLKSSIKQEAEKYLLNAKRLEKFGIGLTSEDILYEV